MKKPTISLKLNQQALKQLTGADLKVIVGGIEDGPHTGCRHCP